MASSLRAWQWTFLSVLATVAATELASYLRFRRKLARLSPSSSSASSSSSSTPSLMIPTVVLVSNKPGDDVLVRDVLQEFIPQCDVQIVVEEDEEVDPLAKARSMASQALVTAVARDHKLRVGIGMLTKSSPSSLTQVWVVIQQEGGKETIACSAYTRPQLDDTRGAVRRAWTQLLVL